MFFKRRGPFRLFANLGRGCTLRLATRATAAGPAGTDASCCAVRVMAATCWPGGRSTEWRASSRRRRPLRLRRGCRRRRRPPVARRADCGPAGPAAGTSCGMSRPGPSLPIAQRSVFGAGTHCSTRGSLGPVVFWVIRHQFSCRWASITVSCCCFAVRVNKARCATSFYCFPARVPVCAPRQAGQRAQPRVAGVRAGRVVLQRHSHVLPPGLRHRRRGAAAQPRARVPGSTNRANRSRQHRGRVGRGPRMASIVCGSGGPTGS